MNSVNQIQEGKFFTLLKSNLHFVDFQESWNCFAHTSFEFEVLAFLIHDKFKAKKFFSFENHKRCNCLYSRSILHHFAYTWHFFLISWQIRFCINIASVLQNKNFVNFLRFFNSNLKIKIVKIETQLFLTIIHSHFLVIGIFSFKL